MARVTLAWPRQATGQLRLPALCVYTGRPAEEGVHCQFFLAVPLRPARHSRYVDVWLPATRGIARRVGQLRLRLFVGIPALLIGGLVLAIVSGYQAESGGGLVWIPLSYLSIAMMVAGLTVAPILLLVWTGWVRGRVGFDDWVRVSRVHPAFAEACVVLNPPGMVRLDLPARRR